jgi:dTDP-glucose 4,6-dehydratase
MVRKSQKQFFSIPASDLDEIARLSAADLGALRGKKMFLTGGTGFFGKWLLAALLHANAKMDLGLELTVLSRDPEKFRRSRPEIADVPSLRWVRGHVADFPAQGIRPDFLVHAATDTTAVASEADENERARAIVSGTQRVLELAQQDGVRMLNVSSGAVYGIATGKRDGAREDDYDAARPVTPYGLAKREAEALCMESRANVVTARAFAFLGPHLPLDAHFAAGNFLRDAMRGGPVLVRGDGTALRSYLYPTDLIVWLLRILVRGERGRAYNVGSNEAVSVAELAHLIAHAVQPKAEVTIQSTQPQGPQNIYLPNIARARADLGLGVTVPLRKAVKRTVDYLKSGSVQR